MTPTFEPTGSYSMLGNRVAWTGACPIDCADHDSLVGMTVIVNGEERRVIGVETKKVRTPPKIGDPISLIFG
jgi:hypothetical protein